MVRVNRQDADNYKSFDYDFFGLKDHNHAAEVRLFYSDPDEIQYDAVHRVVIDQVSKKEKWVDCLRVHTDPIEKCPFCQAGMPVQLKLFLQLYVVNKIIGSEVTPVNRPAIFERGKGYGDVVSTALRRAKLPLVANIFEIVRSGAAKSKETTYPMSLLPQNEPDNTVLEDLGEPVEREKIILIKTVDEMNFYLQHGQFENTETDSNNTPPVQRRTQVNRQAPAPY
jgi:hypothetical protein